MTHFTIIVPTFNHEATLNYSLASIKQQTHKDYSVYIIGDGTTQKTKALVSNFIRNDNRFHFIDKPKGPRNGEIYRHELLQNITKGCVAYLSDDDLWRKDHLQEVALLLTKADFCYTCPIDILPNKNVISWYGDLADPYYKSLFLDKNNKRYNVIPLSCAAHTIAAYKRLPHGWRTTPDGIHTDLYMWQQFLRLKKLAVAKGNKPTVYHFASPARKDWSNSMRLKELAWWFARLEDTPTYVDVLTKLQASTYNDLLTFLQEKNTIENTKSWKTLQTFLASPVGKLVKKLT